MPIYEYECGKCGVFEQSQRITDPALTKCPTCRRKVRRLISSTSFQLKGTGWYVTDYARSGGKGGGKSGDAAGESKSESKSESSGDSKKSESKSSAKADTKASGSASASTGS